MEEHFRVAVIGLGMIGGSLAMALRGFRDAEIIGCDIDPKTRAAAEKSKVFSRVVGDPAEAIKDANLVVLCVYPEAILKIVQENRDAFRPGTVVTDVCGIKREVADGMVKLLPSGVDYVGGHPMAGTENSGFSYASAELFWMTGFIITPMEHAKEESVALVAEMAHYIGATRITAADCGEHDRIIAYTSDLMHLAAAGLCLDFPHAMNRAYTAGAFRDCTRIAKINPKLWTELFLSNRENVILEIDRYQNSLNRLRTAIETNDAAALSALLKTASENKEAMQQAEPEILYQENGKDR